MSLDPLEMRLAKKVAELEDSSRGATFERMAALFQEFADETAETELPALLGALTMLQNQSPTATGRELQMRLLQRWAETDARAAAEGIVGIRAEDRGEACERLGAAWARQNFAEVAKWIETLEGGEQQSAVLAIVNEIASEQPREALALASRTTIPPEKRDAVARAAAAWAVTEPNEAVQWATELEEPSLREPVLAAMAVAIADKNPNEAARLLIGSVPAGPNQQTAALGILQRLAFRDPAAAGAWAEQFPVELRTTALAELNRISERHR